MLTFCLLQVQRTKAYFAKFLELGLTGCGWSCLGHMPVPEQSLWTGLQGIYRVNKSGTLSNPGVGRCPTHANYKDRVDKGVLPHLN